MRSAPRFANVVEITMKPSLLLLAPFGVLLGCTASVPPTPVELTVPVGHPGSASQAPAASALPPLYASLFDQDRKLTFRVFTESAHYDPDSKAADASGSVISRSEADVVCTVADVRTTERDTRVASLACADGDGVPFSEGFHGVTPSGIYVANARGLFKLAEGEMVPDDLATRRPLLAASPRAQKEQKNDGEGAWSREVAAYEDGTWCTIEDFMRGDARHDEVCFQPGRGLVRLEGGSDGGSTHWATFERADTP